MLLILNNVKKFLKTLEKNLITEKIYNTEKELKNAIKLRIEAEEKYKNEKLKLEDLEKNLDNIKFSYETSINSATVASESVEKVINIIKNIDNDDNINYLSNLDLDDIDFKYDYLNYNKEISDNDKINYITLNNSSIKNKSNLLKLIDNGNIVKNPLKDNELNSLLNDLNLVGKISLEKGYINAGIEASKLAKKNAEMIESASIKYKNDKLLEKIKEITHLASFTRILASITSVTKIRYENEIESQKDKVNIAFREFEHKKK